MTNPYSDDLQNTIDAFSQGIIESCKSILKVTLQTNQESLHPSKSFHTQFDTITSIPLAGSISGEIFLCLNISDWQEQFNALCKNLDHRESEAMIFSILGEILNNAGGEILEPLQKLYGSITLLSPRVIIGKIHYPSTNIFNLSLHSKDQLKMEARLSIDLMEQNLRVEHDKLLVSSKLDETGLYNKQYFSKILSDLEKSGENNDSYFSIIFADLNRLKFINDNFGHDAGDIYIQTAAKMVKKSCRSSDRCFRVGGDEIIMLLPNCPKSAAEKVIDRVKKQMESAPLKFKSNRGVSQTINIEMSVGVASNSEGISPKEVVKIADQRMEKMKKDWYNTQGLNRRV